MTFIPKNTYILLGLLLLCSPAFAQFSTCDTTLINAHLNPAGYQRVYIPTQPCSMYYHSTTAKYGIDAARDAFALGIPQLVINNATENSDVSAALFAQGVYGISGSGAAVWLGITDSATTYTWRTIATGGSVSYFNWAAGDPNNLPPSCRVGGSCLFCTGADAYWCAYGEDCAVMEASGQWEDNTCQGSNVKRVVVLELNTCPVIARPDDTTICAGSSASLTASVSSGGTAPYTYTWNPGTLSGPTVTVSPTSTQTYTVEASDHYACKTDSTFTVTVHTSTPPAIIVAQPTVCKGVNDNISLSTVLGTATYTWSFGTGATVVSGSGGGPYNISWSTTGTKSISVTVSDGGCTSNVTQSVTVDSTSAAFTLSPVSTCIGGTVTATVTNVSATATYTWSFGTGTVTSGSGAGPYTITWATPGTKTVDLTVTDNGCTATASQSVNITNGLTPTFTVGPASPCQSQTTTVTLTSGASGTATYAWSFDNAVILSGTGAGPYSVRWDTTGAKNTSITVTDNGCSGTYTQPVNVLPIPTANAGPDIQLCPGVAGTIGSAPVAGDSYSWSPAWGLSSTTVSNPTITIPSNPTGNNIDTFYVVTVSSVTSSCQSTDTVRVTIYPDINSIFTVSPATACQNSSITVTYSGTVSPTATYTWSFGGATVLSGSGAGPYTISYPAIGSQTIGLTVSDNGCPSSSTDTVIISNSFSPSFTLNPSTTACAGQAISVTLTGTPSATATYTWDFNGANVLSGSGAGPYSISWNTNGQQIADLTVTDGGCTGFAADTITIANTATADAGPDIQICPGVAGTLGSTPASGYTYSWSPTAGLSDPTIANPTITIPSNPTGNIIITPYSVTVTSGACSAADTALVTIYPDINNNFTLSSTSVCTGDNVTVSYSGTASGTASYNWDFSGATVVSGSGAGPYTITWTTPGSQPVTLSVTDNGCTATPVSQTVAVGLKPTATAGADQTICSGDSVQLGAAPVSGVTYSWTPATHLSDATISDPYFAEINTGTTPDVTSYMLIANGGCPDTAYVIITANPVTPITIALSGPASFCQGDSVILQDGLAPQADYLWSNGETTSAIIVKTSGTYSITAHDANGCLYISSPSVTVTVNASPIITLAPGGEIDESCTNAKDGSLSVNANGGTQPYTFSWNTTPTQNAPTATSLAPGTYTVSVSDANSCSDTNSFTINAAPFIGLNIDSMRDVSCYKKTDGAIYASVTGGNLPVSYLWSTGAVTPSITNLSADTFSLSITDARGCTVDTSVIITQPAPITFTTVSSLLIDYGGQQEIDITVNPSNPAYDYAWSPAATLSCTVCPNPVASPLQTTTYILTVTDPIGGCSATDTITLSVDPSKKLYIPNAFTPNNDGVNDTYLVSTSGPVRYFEMIIFDRWGEKVYDSNDIGEGWDGRYKGVFVSNGDYVYHATITFLDGQTLSSKGTVTVLK